MKLRRSISEPTRSTVRRWIANPWVVFGALALSATMVLLAWFLTPVPSALLIRALFHENAKKTLAVMQPFAPKGGLTQHLNVQYAKGGTDTQFDVFSPTAASGPLPTVFWIHGGAWVSGSKENVRPYVQLIAAAGFTTVAVNYTVAPEAKYPVAVNQLNDALAYLVAHAAEYNVDPAHIVIAGDSAGANLTSELATIVTNPAYATQVGVTPALTPSQLNAVVLNCGIYDVSSIPEAKGIIGWGFNQALWAYVGNRNYADAPGGEEMSTMHSVTSAFPTTWISGGNADALTATQSMPFAAKLTELGVSVTPVFYAENQEPPLGHEYQFHLTLDAAQDALKSTISFLKRTT